MHKLRFELKDEELHQLKVMLSAYKCKTSDDEYFKKLLLDKLNNAKHIQWSAKKAVASEIATEARMKQAKEKILHAIKFLKFEGKEVTAYRVSKISGVAFQTAQKYLKSLDDFDV